MWQFNLFESRVRRGSGSPEVNAIISGSIQYRNRFPVADSSVVFSRWRGGELSALGDIMKYILTHCVTIA